MSTVTELRPLFVVGIVALGVVTAALAMLAQWLIRRIEHGHSWFARSGPRDSGIDHRRQQLEHQLAARAARWRMLL